MAGVRGERPIEDRPAFEWVGNALCLDFHNTVSWGVDGSAEERLRGYADVLEWSVAARAVKRHVAAALRRAAAADPAAARRAFRRARQLRAEIHDLFSRQRGVKRLRDAAERLNRRLAGTLPHLRVAGPARGFAWKDPAGSLDSPLWPVTWSAARLHASERRERVGRCANDACRWLFVDTSPGGRRRWCDMRACGNRAKVRRHRLRRRRGL